MTKTERLAFWLYSHFAISPSESQWRKPMTRKYYEDKAARLVAFLEGASTGA